MANKFTNFIFTEEGKNIITQVLAAKASDPSVNFGVSTIYTFDSKLDKSLIYSQISSLSPKQTKPVGTVTPQSSDTVEMRLQIDNSELTFSYNLQGIAITGQYAGDNFVLGYINTNESTNVPAYDGTQVQTIALDVSFAISDTSVVQINTQLAGMLTVDDYNALVAYLNKTVAPLAVDSTVVHKNKNETIADVKTFLETIQGSVSGNANTANYLNTHTLSSNIDLNTLNTNGNYLSTLESKTTTNKPSGASEQYSIAVIGSVQLFDDMKTDGLYVRNRVNSTTFTTWKRVIEDVDQTINSKLNFNTAPTVVGDSVVTEKELASVNSSAVHKSGNETIADVKTFLSAINGGFNYRKATFTSINQVIADPQSYTGLWNIGGSTVIDGEPAGHTSSTRLLIVEPVYTNAALIRYYDFGSKRLYKGLGSGGVLTDWIEETNKSIVDALTVRVATEETARDTKDKALEVEINTEKTERLQAESSLGTRITDETTDRTNADNLLDDRIDALYSGGDNLIPKTQAFGFKYSNNLAASAIVAFDATTNMLHITKTASTGSALVGIYFTILQQFAVGEPWEFSVDIKGSGVFGKNGIGLEGSTWSIQPTGNIPTNWTRIRSSGVNKGNGQTGIIYFDATTTNLDVYIKLPKLERGNIPSDWSASSFDSASNDALAGVDAGAVHKSGAETVSGPKKLNDTLSVKEIELLGSSSTVPFIDFHKSDSDGLDYMSRLIETSGLTTYSNGHTLRNKLSMVVADSSRPINIDTLIGGYPALGGFSQMNATVVMGAYTPSGTLPPNFGNYSILKNTPGSITGDSVLQELTDITTGIQYHRTRAAGAWSNWWSSTGRAMNVIAGDDFNKLLVPGFYHIASKTRSDVTNSPFVDDNLHWGELLVMTISTNPVAQMYLGNDNTVATRYLSGSGTGTWTPWKHYSDDSAVMHKSGAETIADVKTFSKPIVGGVTGNAGSATELATPRKINGVAFDGTADISVLASNNSDLIHKSGDETSTGTKTFESVVVSETAKLPLGFDGSIQIKTITSDWGFDIDYVISGNSGTMHLAGTANKNITTDIGGGGDIIIANISGVPLVKTVVARGALVDVTSGTNFGSLRLYPDGRVSMNWNGLAQISGHYIEGSVPFIIS